MAINVPLMGSLTSRDDGSDLDHIRTATGRRLRLKISRSLSRRSSSTCLRGLTQRRKPTPDSPTVSRGRSSADVRRSTLTVGARENLGGRTQD
jgi:hypothetical protein